MISANTAMPGVYDYGEVARSVLIAMAASYAALDLTGRVTAAKGRTRVLWLSGGATAMGIGIWAMHFKGMLAFRLPVPVAYHWPTVLASLLVAVFASAVALFVASRRKMGWTEALIGSVIMGGAIAGMHYIGVAAMRMPAITRFSPWLVISSILLAILVSLIALLMAFGLREETEWTFLRSLGSAIVMGVAISAMHYIGMAAASFIPASPPDLSHTVSISPLGNSGVVLATLLVLLAAVITSSVDRRAGQKRAEDAARRSEKQLRDVIDTIPAMAWSTLPDGANDFANQSWFEYTGISSKDAAGTGWKVSFHPDDIATHLEKWQASLAIGKPFESEARIQRARDGQYRWFLTRAVPVRDENGTILKWYGIATDIDDRKRAEALLTGEKRILEMLAKGDSLGQILDGLCRLVEEQASGVLASILLLDGNRLRHGGAPSLPKAYTDAIDGVVIGPSVGSCGTAAYRGEQVIVEDIATDSLWADYRQVALPHSLRASCSTPVFSSEHKVIATCAMYYREPRTPSPREQEIIEQITRLAGVAIERKLTQEALLRSEAYLAEAQKLSHAGSWAWSPVTRETLYWSEEMFRIYGLDPQQGPPATEAFWNRVHPEDRDSVRELMRMAVQQKAEYVHHHRIVLPDGTVKQIYAKGHPRLDAAGELVEFVGTAVDVTERKRVEEALRRSEAYLSEAQRLTHTGSWAYNPATEKAIYWSEEMFRIFDLDPLQGPPADETVLQRMHPEDRDSTLGIFRKAALEKTELECHHRLVLPDGTVKYIHVIGHPVFDLSGEVIEFVGTNVNETERKRSEEALRRNEAYLAEAQRLAHTGSWAYNPATEKAIYWSEEMFRIFGLDPRNSSPPDREWFLRLMHPDDRDEFNERVKKAFREQGDFVQDFRIVLPDGTVKHLHEIGHPVLDEAGNIIEYVGTEVDVTERKRSEEEVRTAETRFRASVDHLTDALFIHDDQDDQGRVMDVNQQACNSLGYTREELIGMTAFDYDAFVDATFMRSIKERVARGETFSFESVHRRKDGTTFPVEVRARPFWHGDHRFGLALVRDITDRKRAEAERERLRQLEAELAHMNRVSMMGELAASLAHEIKQPIAAAVTNANTSLRWLARDKPDLAEAREAIMRIAKDGTRAAEIINRLRSFYMKGAPPQPELVDLNEVAREMLMLLRDEGNRYSIAMRMELGPELPKVMTDRVQLQQVLMNLMLNAIEAMKETAGELTIKSQLIDSGQLLVSVSDTGVGLPADKPDQIFNAFFTTKPQGTGMGLAITRSIIEASGGRLWASANAGRGATFHFTLPCEASASSTSAG